MRFSELNSSNQKKLLKKMPENRATITLLFALDVMAMWEAWNAHKGPSRVHTKVQ